MRKIFLQLFLPISLFLISYSNIFGQTLLKQMQRGNLEFKLFDNGFRLTDVGQSKILLETYSSGSDLSLGFASYPYTTVDYSTYIYSIIKDSTLAYQWWTDSLTTWSAIDSLYIVNASFRNTANGEVMQLKMQFISDNRMKVEINKANPVAEPWKYRTRLRLKLFPDEYFLGFGERIEGVAFRNKKMLNWISESRVGNQPWPNPENQGNFRVPFYLSTRGYGLLINENSCSSFDLGESNANINEFAVWDQQLSFTVYTGNTPAEIIENYTDDVGRIHRTPEPWVFGVWIMTKNRNGFLTETDRSIEVAQKLRNNDIPTSALFHHYWSEKINNILSITNGWVLDQAKWPNYSTLAANHHNQGFNLLHYYWPYIFNNDAEYSYANSQGYFMKNSLGNTYLNQWLVWFNQVAEPDLTRQVVRNWYKNDLMMNAFNLGSSGWMADFGDHHRVEMIDSANGNPYAMHNAYPLWWAKTNQEFWEQNKPDGDYIYFMRGGWTGMQKYSPMMIGDPVYDWSDRDGIKSVINTNLSAGVSGHPLVCQHFAGYSYDFIPSNSEELWIRWLELSALMPVLWSHEGDELYFGTHPVFDQSPQTLQMLKKYAKIHVQFFPYIYTLVKQAKETGVPITRPLYLHYPNDPTTLSVTTQFLLGDRVLVAPVVDSAATSRSVYFPSGTWYDFWTGLIAAQGPTTISVNAPIDHLPIFVKEGTILPLYNQPHIATLVKNVSGVNDFEYADSTMEFRFYGCGADQLELWDSTLVQMYRFTGDSATNISGGNVRQYTSSYIYDNSLICYSGISEQKQLTTLNVYPNPTTGFATLSIEVRPKTQSIIEIYDIAGSLLQSEKLTSVDGTTNQQIDISNLPSGIYMLKVTNLNSYKTIKIIKH